MKTTINPSLKYWTALALRTRRFGSCYVHASARDGLEFWFKAFEHDGVVFRLSMFGRSKTKYKVHATRDGKPVPSKELSGIL